MGLPLHSGPVGESGGGLFTRTFERKEKKRKDLEDTTILSQQAI